LRTPVPWAELRIVDLVTGDPVPSGVHVDIQVRSEQVMTGYWRQPDANADASAGDGWLRTNDVGPSTTRATCSSSIESGTSSAAGGRERQ
jgi:long-subunit acyl-CoA synthetase (AMP-forming)